MVEALQDDLNTSLALTQILNQVKSLNQLIRAKEKNNETILKNYNTLLKMTAVIGFVFESRQLTMEELELYQNWLSAKEAKDFETADRLRMELIKREII